MRINISINESTTSSQLAALSAALLVLSGQTAQPAVAQNNTGSNVSGAPLILTPSEDVTVSNEAAPPAASAPVKKRHSRSKPEEPVAPPPEPPKTLDDIRAALQDYAGKHGIPASIDLLKKFNAARVSEVDESDYDHFIDLCELEEPAEVQA